MKKLAIASLLTVASSSVFAGTVSLPGAVIEDPLTIDADNGQGNFKNIFSFTQWWEDNGTATSLSVLTEDNIANNVVDLSNFTLNGVGAFSNEGTFGTLDCVGCNFTFTFEGLGLKLVDSINELYLNIPGFQDLVDNLENGIITQDQFNTQWAGLVAGTGNILGDAFIERPDFDINQNSILKLYKNDENSDGWIAADMNDGVLSGAEEADYTNGAPWLTLQFIEANFNPENLLGSFGDILSNGTSDFGLRAIGGDALTSFTEAPDLRHPTIGLNEFADVIGFGLQATFDDNGGTTYSLYSGDNSGDVTGIAVTEPATLAIIGLGLLGFAGAARRKQAK